MTPEKLFSIRVMLSLCGTISAVLLVVAFGFEHLGGLAPCKLCLWQRWPHAGVILFSLMGLAGLRAGPCFVLIALSAALTATIAGYHFGVEQQFWPGPASCSAGLDGGSAAMLLDSLLATPVVRCDQIAWSFMGLSMAGWNMLISLGLVLLALFALRCKATCSSED